MNIVAPQSQNPVAEGGLFSLFWMEWLRDIWTGLGFNYQQPMYNDQFMDGNIMAASIGTTTLVTIDGNMDAPQLRTGQDDGRQARFRLGNDYRDNTDLNPFIVFAQQTAGAGNVMTRLSHMASPEGTALAEAIDDGIVTAAPEVAWAPVRVNCEAIDGADLVKGSIVQLIAEREGSNALDTLAADCVLLGVGFKFQLDGVGNESLHP